MCELEYWIALSSVPGIGSRSFFRLTEMFGSPKAVWNAGEADLRSALETQPELVRNLLQARTATDPDRLLSRLRSAGAEAVIHSDPRYPELLWATATPPPVLYYIGELPGPEDVCVSVVGTRRPTPYGCRCAFEIAAALARCGFWVVSGMALGIDSWSHKGALDSGGNTLAVLGCGPDIVYPRQNRSLYDRITHAGAVVSEYYLGMLPVRSRFPARNRIVSGLSIATVVVQAGQKSGALITARFALEQGRDVYVVPGDIHLLVSRGTHLLLYDGAAPVVSVEKLISDLYARVDVWRRPAPMRSGCDAAETAQCQAAGGLSSSANRIMSALSNGCETVDAIAEEADMDVSEVLSELSLLELAGKVIRHPSGSYGIMP